MAQTPLEKVKYKKVDGNLSDNQPDVEKTDVNVDPSISHLNKIQGQELMEIFAKTNLAIEQLNKFISTFNNEGTAEGIADQQGVKWNATTNKFEGVTLQTTTFDPSTVKVENSLGNQVSLAVMDGTTNDKTLISKAKLPKWVDITSTYATRDFSNDIGKKVRIIFDFAMSSREMIGFIHSTIDQGKFIVSETNATRNATEPFFWLWSNGSQEKKAVYFSVSYNNSKTSPQPQNITKFEIWE